MSAAAESEGAPLADAARPAVQRVYRELLDRGEPDRFAFEAALTVYLWHHPRELPKQAQAVVQRWLFSGRLH